VKRPGWATLALTLLLGLATAYPQSTEGPRRYWVFFTDKGPGGLRKTMLLQQVREELSEKALQRRAKVAGAGPVVDETDLPLYQPYIQTLEQMGHEPVVRSRWLNAVSVPLTRSDIATLASLPFVRSIRPVARRRYVPEPARPLVVTPPVGLPKGAELDYGPSLSQNALINVPRIHRLGITGRGVYVGMLDTGFRYQEHKAFASLKVLGEFDFINNDGVTRNEPGDAASQDNHGTWTLSTIAGFRDGVLIGPAFGASFFLAKTELVPKEIPAEEDYWVAGIEWLERQGADVVSSSLGYIDWYTYADMDGNTAVTTKAADLAVAKGVVVVNSVGNEALQPWRHMIAPADGDSVIAVGAVNADGVRALFSSVGPTFDGRIKPDVMAMGQGVVVAQPGKVDQYQSLNGTSFSCPLVAGAVALILSAHPELTPMQVYEALTKTADRASSPDTLYGYGIVDAWQALLYYGPVFSNLPTAEVASDSRLRVSIKAASKDGIPVDGVRLVYHTNRDTTDRTAAMIPSGVESEFVGEVNLSGGASSASVYFTLTDEAGNSARWPISAPDQRFLITPDGRVAAPPLRKERGAPPTTFQLFPNYPNPFSRSTTISFDLVEGSVVTLTIYNVLGQRVRRLIDHEPLVAGRQTFSWDARNDRGKRVSGGVYICVIETTGRREAERMVYFP